jgi:hypothetical protein
MTRYYFHIRDELVVIPDDEGLDLLDMHAARIEARLSALDLGMAEIRKGCGVDRRAIEIADRKGKILETVPIRAFLH